MVVTYEEIKPYLKYLNFHSKVSMCSLDFFERVDTCVECQFNGESNECMLSNQNAHFSQLIRMLKAKHPELFL